MTIKQILSSIFMFGLIASSNAMSSESDSTKSIPFKLNSKTDLEKLSNPAVNVFQKIDEREYAFVFIPENKRNKAIIEHDGSICLHCPDINAIILSPDSEMNCKNLHICGLSQQLIELEKENAELKKHIANLEKQNQHK